MAYITNIRIKNKVAKTFCLEPEDVVCERRTPLVVQARSAYILAVYLLGNDVQAAKEEINKGATPPLYYIDRAIELCKNSSRFQERIREIVGYYDYSAYEQFCKAQRLKIEELPKTEEELEKQPEKEEGKLFLFTEEEDKAIERIKKEAEEWFEKKYNYGLKRMPIVNRRRYY